MHWFMHPNNLWLYPIVAKVRGEFGPHGYAAVCLILERITEAWNVKKGERASMPELSLPIRDWQKLLEFSPKKLQKFIEICQNNLFITMEIEGKMLRAKAPILLKLRDEYTDKQLPKSRQHPDDLPTKSGINKQIEPNVNKRQNNTASGLFPEDEKAVRKVLWQCGIDPDSQRGGYCLDYAAERAKDTPAGYIVGTLRKNPNFGLDNDRASPGKRTNEPQHIRDCLKQMVFITNNEVQK